MRAAEIRIAALRYINICRKIMGHAPLAAWGDVARCDKASALLVARAILKR